MTGGRVIDVSLPIGPDMLKYPTDPTFSREIVLHVERGDVATVSLYHLPSHTGTHVDPPCHFLAGAGGIESIAVDRLIGPCHVLEFPEEVEWVTAGLLAPKLPAGARIVLLRTRNSIRGLIRSKEFSREYTALALDAAELLAERGVQAVGIDYLSIEKDPSAKENPDFKVHRSLLGSEIAVLEGLDLTEAREGEGFLSCLPLNITGGDGGPARAVLIQD